uniref:MTRF1L release factor glutamine methyltransferase isoform X2 n=1 Tax=Myxine glutinosa TaxID=7769 RepID=UPI00358E422A
MGGVLYQMRMLCTGRSSMRKVSWAGGTSRPAVPRRSSRNATMWLRLWRRRFALRGVSEPKNSAQLLLAHCLGADTIYGVPEKTLNRSLSGDQQRLFDEMCRKRLQGLPVQYILGEWTFRDIKLRMKPPVLIPRPETEELVGLVLDSLKHVEVGSYQPDPQGVPASGPSLLDAGCGSGAICLSLLHSLPTARAVAVDKSEDAVSLTRLNATSLNLLGRCNVLHMDLTAGLAQRELAALGPFDIVVSNPPYVLSSHLPLLQPEVRWFEDRGALDGGKDGMDVLRVVLTLASEVLKDHGLRFCILRKISQDEEPHGK